MDNKKKIGFMQGCLASFVILVLLVFGFFAFLMLGIKWCCGEVNMADRADTKCPVDECGPKFNEVWSAGTDSKKSAKVVRIMLSGIISRQRSSSMFDCEAIATSAIGVRDRILAAKNDKNVRAIIIEINSPGGEVTMSDLVWHELQEFKSSATNRVVFAHLMDMACSGGYYVAAAADYIYALPTTVTGSIGVIIPAVNAAALAEKVGVKPVSIASSKNKDLLNPLMPTDPEHVAIVKKTVDETYERFVDVVAKGRKMPKDCVRKIADGRILSAEAAREAKLVDAIGYENDVLRYISHKLDSEVKVVRYESGFSFENFILDGMMMKFSESIKHSIMSIFTDHSMMQYR